MGVGPPRRNTGCRRAKGRTARHGIWEHQEARLAVLPGEDGAMPHRAVPPLDEEPAHPAVLVVPVPDSDSGAPLQGVS